MHGNLTQENIIAHAARKGLNGVWTHGKETELFKCFLPYKSSLEISEVFWNMKIIFEIFLKYVWNIVEILRDYFLNRSKFLRISNSIKGPRKTWWYRCNVWNCNNTETFFTDSCVCHGWRCGLQLCIEIIFAFLLGTPRKTIFRQWGGELPNGMGSPVTARTIGEYLQQMRHKVAQHGFRQMINTRLTGHVQIDETFVATKRKHNRGRVKRNRKFTLVRH